MKIVYFAEVHKEPEGEATRNLVTKMKKHCQSLLRAHPGAIIIYSFGPDMDEDFGVPDGSYKLLNGLNGSRIEVAAFLAHKFNCDVVSTSLDVIVDNLDWVDEMKDVTIASYELGIAYFKKSVFKKAERERIHVRCRKDVKFKEI